MFPFICKTIVHVTQNHNTSRIIHSKTLKCHFLRNTDSLLSLRLLSSSSNQHSFTVSYLINSCGLSSEYALRASKYVKIETPDVPDKVISFLQTHGFSKSQISDVARKAPALLKYNPQNTLLPKFLFFHSKGFTPDQLAGLLARNPKILERSLKNYIIPCFEFLKNWLKTDRKTSTVIRREPRILTMEYDLSITPVINIMREAGLPDQNIALLLLHNPRMFRAKEDKLRMVVNEVKKLGFNPSKSQFAVAVLVMMKFNKISWDKKAETYKKWGWSEEEVLEAFGKYPWSMTKSEDKIDATLGYFVNELGWKPSDVAKIPIVVSMSLENRIKPRVAVVQFLMAKGLSKENISWNSYFGYSETLFQKKFVDRYVGEAPQLLVLYEKAFKLSS